MEKALNVMYALREAVSLSKNYPSDEILDEAIAELEAMKQRTCEGCKLYYMESNKKSCPMIQGYSFSYPKMPFSCSYFEPKDNA